jgi:hypothetical protein
VAGAVSAAPAWRRYPAWAPGVGAWDRPLKCSLTRLRPEAEAAGWSGRVGPTVPVPTACLRGAVFRLLPPPTTSPPASHHNCPPPCRAAPPPPLPPPTASPRACRRNCPTTPPAPRCLPALPPPEGLATCPSPRRRPAHWRTPPPRSLRSPYLVHSSGTDAHGLSVPPKPFFCPPATFAQIIPSGPSPGGSSSRWALFRRGGPARAWFRVRWSASSCAGVA